MKIRKALPEDAGQICKMHRLTIQNVNSNDYPKNQITAWSKRSTPKWIRKIIENPDVYYYVATENKKIIGFCDFDKEKLRGLYIHPKWIGKGVGKKLIKKAESLAMKKGIKEFKTVSTLTAFKFYEKMGFKKVRKGKYRIGKTLIDVYYMKKKLGK